ncbi:DUF1120 domain-containing protein [Pseudomonas chlororaphis]|uniref:DUF1120 domain-containing protein n=1 Tax=Pseudomonas chlororaphis TaxID=587753 RepID=UPI003529E473
MNFPKKVMLGSVLLLGATSVLADTADLRVIGTIAPGACTPVFAGGATVDYGVIPLSSLSQTAATTLAPHEIGYTITCNAPISISTNWSDSRAGTVSTPNVNLFGLGTHNGVNIGNYRTVQIVAGATADGNPVSLIQRANPTAAWTAGGNTINVASNGLVEVSYAPVGTVVPGAYSEYAGMLRVTATIDPVQNLDTSTEVTLDGLSTMTVNYL